ncbi:hypothetical protein BDZ45DRAFT_687352 [Acephala macrosclerotiorum]|nr:hypothetical protein BDZ45DRAFT_687352 [Acephala macrosclerotiorum]
MDANSHNNANGNQDKNIPSEDAAKTARTPLPSSPLRGRVCSEEHQVFIVRGPQQSRSLTAMNVPNTLSMPTPRSAPSAASRHGGMNLTAYNSRQTQATYRLAPEHQYISPNMVQSAAHAIIQQERQKAYQSPYAPQGSSKCPYCPVYLNSPQEMVDHIQTQH